MVKWGVRSMVWYVFLLLIAFCVAVYNYISFINDPVVSSIFFS